MSRTRRFEADVPGGGTFSFSHRGRGAPSPDFCYAMQLLAATAMAHMGIESRACNPLVGDRLIGRDQTTAMEVKEVSFGEGSEILVKYTLAGSSQVFTDPLKAYQWMIECALKSGETFHGVEDDDE
jgi:hypothetical protein